MLNKSITILGSTGSIGKQTLEVASSLGCKITALTANTNILLLEQQAREYTPRFVAVGDTSLYSELKIRLADTPIKVLAGEEAIASLASEKTDVVLNSIVGIAGLNSTINAINAGNTLALANKESLVTGGDIVMKLAKEKNTTIIPVDSEHSAIFQCLNGENSDRIDKVILTASGGPFFGRTLKELENVTLKDALKHPNWSMGAKITIDSATLMNKGLEFIEAMHLFAIKPELIEIVVHRQSIVHSAVMFLDGSVIAQMGSADMRTPIQYALTYPDRDKCISKKFNIFDHKELTFEKPDIETFRCLKAALKATEYGGIAPTLVNGANEQAVALFLEEKIKFTQIFDLVEGVLQLNYRCENFTIEEIFAADKLAREYVIGKVKGRI